MASGNQFPSFSKVPESKFNAWEDVRDLCAAYGLVLDPWQENVLRAALGERSDGTWAASRVCMSVPRQQGKTALFEARELAGLLLFGEQLIVHSAHLVPTALEGFQRIKGYFENYDDLRRKVRRIREANGDQMVEMMSGQRLLFKARARGSGRGFSADVLMLDEAQELPERAWAAMLPTMSARPNPQAWLAGTPPSPLDDGETFTRMRAAARAGKDRRLCWLEWSVDDPDADAGDRKMWALANPGLGRRISHEAVLSELNSMSAETFARERLGRWDAVGTSSVFNPSDWAACSRSERPSDLALSALGVAVTMDLTAATIVGAGAHEGEQWVKPLQHGPGTGWLIDRCVQLQHLHRAPVVVDGRGPAAVFIPHLERAGVQVVTATTANYLDACAGFDTAVREQTLRHVESPELDAAVEGAKRRDVGERWAWGRKKSESNIAPLEAATLAVWVLEEGGGPSVYEDDSVPMTFV